MSTTGQEPRAQRAVVFLFVPCLSVAVLRAYPRALGWETSAALD